MARPNLKPHLDTMIRTIGTKNTYHGNRISPSLMSMLVIEERQNGAGILAPYWWGVTQRGRGPRKSTTDHGLVNKIFAWMQKRNLFKSRTPEGQQAEAKSMTWYINKHGNEQFRKKVFIDIYETARKQCIDDVMKEYSLEINKITQDIL